VNRYLKKIASEVSKDNQKLKRIGTGAAIGAGTLGAVAGVYGYRKGYDAGSQFLSPRTGKHVGKLFASRMAPIGAAIGATIGAGAGYLYNRKKLLEKAASLLKGKRFVGRIDKGTFKITGKGRDLASFDRLHSLHETVQRQVENGAPPIKHRLTMGDGSKAFIRGNSKGVKSRLYRE
jgi:hypothetical protein